MADRHHPTRPAASGSPSPPAAAEARPGSAALRRGLVISLLLGLAASVAVAGAGDFADVGDAVAGMRAAWLVPALALGLLAHGIRWWRWHWFLHHVTRPGEVRLGVGRSALVFAAGVAMQVTPGRVGEWVKSYYVQADGGPPASRTAPIILAERITDMLGLVLLAAAGLLIYRTAAIVVALSAALALVLLAVLTHRGTAEVAQRLLARLPFGERLRPHAGEFSGAAADLLTWRTVPAMSLVAYASWWAETAAYWCVLRGLGIEATWDTVFQAAFAWPVATLAGGLLLTPGGLGVAEGGLTALGATVIDGLARGPAAAAALLARLATLWLPTALGLLAMGVLARSPRGEGERVEA